MKLIEKIINKLIWPSTLIDGVNDDNIFIYLKKNINLKTYILIVARLLIRLFSTIISTPICCILYILGYRVIYGCYFKQIGEISLLDSRIRCDIVKKRKYKYIIFISKNISDNYYMFSLYKKYLIVIEPLLLKIILFPIVNNLILWRLVRIFDESKGRMVNYRTRSFNLFQKKYNNSLIQFPKSDIIKARNIIVDLGKKNIHKFVSLHVRTTSFDGGINRNSRCADIRTYLPTIDYLIKNGIGIIRIGDAGMPTLLEYENNPLFLDAKGLGNEMFDIFCLANCEFLIGTGSGPSDIPCLFGVNTITTNMFPSHGALRPISGDLSIFKKLLDSNSRDQNYKFIKNNIDLFISYERDFQALGVRLVDNTAEEILEVVKTYLNTNKNNSNNKYSLLWKKILNKSHRDYKSVGNYSEKFIEQMICAYE